MPMFVKLVALFLSISLIPVVVLFSINLSSIKTTLQDSAFQQLIIARDSKQDNIEKYFRERRSDVVVLSQSQDVKESLVLFEEAFDANNLYNDEFNLISSEYHTYFESFINEYGYYDLFLIDLEGNLVYTVIKESDFGTNILNGPYKDSGLAFAFRQGRNDFSIADYQPYEPSANIPAAFISYPVKNDTGQLLGVLALQLSDDVINGIMLNGTGLGQTGETYLVGGDYLMRSDSRFSEEKLLGIKRVETNAVVSALDYEIGVMEIKDGQGKDVFSAYAPLDIEGINWVIIAEIHKEEAMATEIILRKSAYRLIGIISIVVIIIAVTFAMSMTRPIKKLLLLVQNIASGDLSTPIKIKSRDEIGKLGYYCEEMRHNLGNMLKHIKEEAGMMAKDIAASTREISGATEQNINAAEQVTIAIENMTHGFEKQKDFSEEVSQAMQQMSAGTQHFADSAYSVSLSAEKMNEETAKGNDAVLEVDAQMEAISHSVAGLEKIMRLLLESSNEIGQISEVISNVSAQTNLLALNAAIEAARAGEHGKGFAVVAEEIRVLADQSKASTNKITKIIETIQVEAKESFQAVEDVTNMVSEGKKVVNQAGLSFRNILNESEQVHKQVQDISSLSQEIAAGAQEVTASTSHLSEIAATSMDKAQSVNALSEEQLQSLEEISASIQTLESLVEELDDLMRNFKL